MSTPYDVIIIGSGPAGGTAALYASRAGLKPLVLHGETPGGQLTGTTDLENFPGWTGTGPELVEFIEQQATSCGAEFKYEIAQEVDFKSNPKKVVTETATHFAKTVIIATGASAKYLGLESENRLKGKGVCACATCDGPLFKQKPVVVVGGGDAACEEAIFLSKICSSVKMVYRGSELKRASLPMRRKLESTSVEVIYDSVVDEVLGSQSVEGVKVKNLKTNDITEIQCDGLFIAIGHTPATSIFKGHIDLHDDGYIKTTNGPRTSVDGVFACGDCADRVYRQAITSAATGCQAALLAERFLDGGNETHTTNSAKCCILF